MTGGSGRDAGGERLHAGDVYPGTGIGLAIVQGGGEGRGAGPVAVAYWPRRSVDTIRTVAVDWSGALAGERRKIWLAEARAGRLVRLEAGRSREEVIREVVGLRQSGQPIVVGLDFAFSFPAWFVRQMRCASAEAIWGLAARDGEQWLARCGPPFWGRTGKNPC